jgi:CubicO group peptidase (beta-lactamase class C family)
MDRRSALRALGLGALALGCRRAAAGRPSREADVTRTGGGGARSLRDALAPFAARGEVPGIVAAVERGGRVELEALGVKAAGGADPVRRDTIFRVASMTKPVTAAAAMILVEEGRIALDEPVDRLLPELAHRRVLRRIDGPLDDTVPARRAITVRDLLAFRMGFGIVLAPPGTYPIQRAMDELRLGQHVPSPSEPPPPDEWIRRLGTLPLMGQPGESWMYNTGADVLSVLVARAAGRPFEAFLRERILEPLGMRDTGFSVPAPSIDRLATSYLVDPKTGALAVYDPARGGQWSRPPAFPSGGGGLVSTVDDFLAFGRMMLGGGVLGGARILSRRSVELMTADQLTPAQKAATRWVPGFFGAFGWGLGMAVVTGRDELGRARGAFGWDGGLGTSWWSDPGTATTGVLLTQRAWTSPVPPEVCRAFWRAAT